MKYPKASSILGIWRRYDLRSARSTSIPLRVSLKLSQELLAWVAGVLVCRTGLSARPDMRSEPPRMCQVHFRVDCKRRYAVGLGVPCRPVRKDVKPFDG